MKRRTFLGTLGAATLAPAAPALAAGMESRPKTTSGALPRKVIVGTVMQSFWGPYPGLSKRLEQLAGLIEQMAAQAKSKYGRHLDLAVLPETSITGEADNDALAHSVSYEGAV